MPNRKKGGQLNSLTVSITTDKGVVCEVSAVIAQ